MSSSTSSSPSSIKTKALDNFLDASILDANNAKRVASLGANYRKRREKRTEKQPTSSSQLEGSGSTLDLEYIPVSNFEKTLPPVASILPRGQSCLILLSGLERTEKDKLKVEETGCNEAIQIRIGM
jgi:hypothetical protein